MRATRNFCSPTRARSVPIRVAQLGDLRRFNEELRTALGVPTYYNEALGSTCQYSVYDRVKGRVGDVPDETVGAHEDRRALKPRSVHPCDSSGQGANRVSFDSARNCFCTAFTHRQIAVEEVCSP